MSFGEISEVTDIKDVSKSIWGEGAGFDGSSIRGFQKIQESDMILILDPDTAIIDPIMKHPTISVICDIYDPLTREPYSRDPRYITKKAEKYLKTTGIADMSYWGPEAEFFIFDDVRYDQTENSGYYYIDSIEGEWNTGREENPNLGYKPRFKEGYFPAAPHDSLQDLRMPLLPNPSSEIILPSRISTELARPLCSPAMSMSPTFALKLRLNPSRPEEMRDPRTMR